MRGWRFKFGFYCAVWGALIVGISLVEGKGQDHPKAVRTRGLAAVSDPVFNLAAFVILGITAALYAIFW